MNLKKDGIKLYMELVIKCYINLHYQQKNISLMKNTNILEILKRLLKNFIRVQYLFSIFVY